MKNQSVSPPPEKLNHQKGRLVLSLGNQTALALTRPTMYTQGLMGRHRLDSSMS